VRGESGLVVRGKDVAEPYLVASWCATMNLTKKTRKIILKLKKLYSPYYNIPVHTHNTAVWVCGGVGAEALDWQRDRQRLEEIERDEAEGLR